jgi:hypothetical protein
MKDNGDSRYDRRSSWAQYQVYVLAELKNLGRQGEKIETHLLELVHRVDGRFTELDNRITGNEKEVERIKTKVTMASAIVGAIVSAAVSLSGFFFGKH